MINWIAFTYLIGTLGVAWTAKANAGWGAGIAALATSFIFMTAGVSFKVGLFADDVGSKIGIILTALLFVGLGFWTGQYFSVVLHDHELNGVEWGGIGMVLNFLANDRNAFKSNS